MCISSLVSRVTVLAFLLIVVISCGNNSKSNDRNTLPPMARDTIHPSNNDQSIPGSFSTQTQFSFDSSQLKVFLNIYSQFKPFEKDIYSFYRGRKYAYAWFDEKGLIESANNLYNRINNIHEEGLPDKIPYKENFTSLMDAGGNENKPSDSLELMLTCQYLNYAKYVWKGLSEKETNKIEWLLPRKKLTYAQLLDSLANRSLASEPVFRQYHLLKDYLKKYRDIQAQKKLPVIKTNKKKLQLNDSGAVIHKIREWLYTMGDIAANNNSHVFDNELLDGVKQFQYRIGLKEDGIIGPGVIAEMNTPIEKRIESIMINMERSRWVPDDITDDYLLVNIPEYKLHVIEDDKPIFSMNVVVGKSQNKTVIFNGDLKYVVFSPYWNIPPSILKKETLPAIKRNPNYLAQHNMEWNGGNVRQKPGPNNSLGLVKFLFPNSHSIYLHDTPSKSLFNESTRAFSHGCIRVAEPKKLALYLLRNDGNWNEASITAAMNSGKEKTVTLKKTVPVFIAYFTTWVNRDGQINFRKDVYDRDSRLAKLILEKPTI
jgi:murein L,D-transpeptidase YcbB/YkuD